MRRVNMSMILWGLFWLIVITYAIQHPAQVAGWIVTAKDAIIIFVTTIAAG